MNFIIESWVFQEIIGPILDILILSMLIYQGYKILVKTRAVQLVKGAFFILLIYLFAFLLNLETMLWILNMLAPGMVIGIAIVFQPELRKIFTRIGQGDWFRLSSSTKTAHLDSVLNSIEVLSGRKRGCLIVFARSVGLKNIIDTGTMLNAELTSSLILTIFGHDTPLHDGALLVQNGKLIAAGCFLPLSEQSDIRKSFGTRHRAALGLAEESDAIILIVSEETGAISLAYDANLYYDLSIAETTRRIKDVMNFQQDDTEAEEEELFEE
ncbi:MAG: diadenylate cyclase CdaA [Spirochaetia bacterium]